MTPRKPTYPPPAGLSDRARTLWSSVVPSRAVSPGRLAMVTEALRALDRADQAAAAIQAEGLTFTTATTGAVHVHPLVKVERESRQLFARLWSDLRLDFDRESDGRVRAGIV